MYRPTGLCRPHRHRKLLTFLQFHVMLQTALFMCAVSDNLQFIIKDCGWLGFMVSVKSYSQL